MAIEASRPKLGSVRMPDVKVTLHIHTGASDMADSKLAAAQSDGEKKSKDEVNYTTAAGTGEDNCGRCKNADFSGVGGTCSKVAGEVRRGYVCRLFESATLTEGGQP